MTQMPLSKPSLFPPLLTLLLQKLTSWSAFCRKSLVSGDTALIMLSFETSVTLEGTCPPLPSVSSSSQKPSSSRSQRMESTNQSSRMSDCFFFFALVDFFNVFWMSQNQFEIWILSLFCKPACPRNSEGRGCPVGAEQRSTQPTALPVHGSRDALFRDQHASPRSVHCTLPSVHNYDQSSVGDVRQWFHAYSLFYLFIDLLPSLTSFFLNLLTIAFTTACGREFQTLITCCEKRCCLLAVSNAQLVSLCAPSF